MAHQRFRRVAASVGTEGRRVLGTAWGIHRTATARSTRATPATLLDSRVARMASTTTRLTKAMRLFLDPRSPAAVYRNPIPLVNFTRAFGLNFLLRRSLLSGGRGVVCNTCGWRGSRYGYSAAISVNTFHRDAVCLGCGAQPRIRALTEIIRRTLPLTDKLDVLDVGAAPATSRLFVDSGKSYRVLDPYKDASVPGSITSIGAAEATFDAILCCHVLEHVRDYRAALREMGRVLKPGGRAIIMVPQIPGLKKSRPLSGPSYMGYGHLWDFGEDFPQLLEENGFVILHRDARSEEDPASRFHIATVGPA